MRTVLILFLTAWLGLPAQAQFTHRYPKVEGYRHHIYLEGYELPILAAGVVDPAPAPDGSGIAFASRGWLWMLDLEEGRARRLTRGAGVDASPAWHPGGNRLAFTRDDGSDTRILELDLQSGGERALVDSGALDLHPAYSPDGQWLYFSTAQSGDLDIWRLGMSSGESERITDEAGLEVRPQPSPDGTSLVYLKKTRGGRDQLRLLRLEDDEETVLKNQSIASQTHPALGPEGRRVAAAWPSDRGWNLWLLDVGDTHAQIQLTRSHGLPLHPAWSPGGETIYFCEADPRQVFRLKRVPAAGGDVEEIGVGEWDWGEPTRRVRIRTRIEGRPGLAPARLLVEDAQGRPHIPDSGQVRFDSQSGLAYFYSGGIARLRLPEGDYRVTAVQGLATPPASASLRVGGESETSLDLALKPVWDARAAGWRSGDHHFHLNYGGPYTLQPQDLLPMLHGEGMDVATPLLANLHNRFEDLKFWGRHRLNPVPIIAFGQEVRSHFLGHLGLIGIDTVFWPWYWGPGYQVYSRDDRPNALALEHTREQGGVGAYVHPVSRRDPFSADGPASIPAELIADAVTGALDALEVACLWSDEIGTSKVWHHLLNVGVPLAPWAGTDAFPNFYRSMAVGTTRVYVRPEGAFNYRSYLDALRAGRSFVTNGPMLDLRISQARPGEVIEGDTRHSWQLEVHSALPFQSLEVLVNGESVWSGAGLEQPGSRSFSGELDLPESGWAAAQAYGGDTSWPAMDSYPFAHTSPVWIGRKASLSPQAAASAQELLRALQAARNRLESGYQGTEIPNLLERFDHAQAKLEQIAGGGSR